ncbi:ribosome silencing factor [uncultured Tyzzerella sp.]|uniref:ribosome silencing factor n=1 Tax=uncultured Tyzzerella sp. TaxID=2321398 RepID=UPI002942833E|nr:ribosome silencing factor [uncultured Tyzzerella sp.]
MNKEQIFESVKVAYKALDDKMGIDIKVIDISSVSPIADYFVIASANNSSQLRAMADAVEEELHKKCNVQKTHSEGTQTKSWILLDFNDIVVHLFNEEDREFYNIERIWADAENIDESLLK